MDAETQLRQLKQQTDQRRRDFEAALARAKAVREQHDQDLNELQEKYGLESVAEAEEWINQKETEIANRIEELRGQLA